MSNACGKSEYNNGHCDGCSDIRALQGEVKAMARAVERRNKQIAELKVKVDERNTLEAHLRLAVAEREKFKGAFDHLQGVRDAEIAKRGEMREELVKLRGIAKAASLPAFRGLACTCHQEDSRNWPCGVCQLRNALDGYSPQEPRHE